MNRPIKAILFDLNETLIHQIRTESSHIASTYAAVTKLYWDITYESFEAAWKRVHSLYALQVHEGRQLVKAGNYEDAKEKLREPWYRENIAGIFEMLNLPPSNQLIEKITWAFQDSWVGGLRMPEVNKSVLENLTKDDYQLGIVTNFQQPNIVSDILRNFGIDGYFKTVVISANLGYRKPHPDIFKSALTELNMELTPERVVYVGDNPEEDVEGAKRVGLKPILIDRENRFSDIAKYVISIQSLTELQEAILNK